MLNAPLSTTKSSSRGLHELIVVRKKKKTGGKHCLKKEPRITRDPLNFYDKWRTPQRRTRTLLKVLLHSDKSIKTSDEACRQQIELNWGQVPRKRRAEAQQQPEVISGCEGAREDTAGRERAGEHHAEQENTSDSPDKNHCTEEWEPLLIVYDEAYLQLVSIHQQCKL